MSLLQKIEAWQSAGLIDDQQKQAIMAYEKNNSSNKLPRILYFLACFTIGLGMVSVVAANWDIIPTLIKILCDFALLVMTAAAIFKSATEQNSRRFEGLLLFFPLLIMGSIGLIAQVFNLQSNNLSAILLWSVLTAPLLIQTKKIMLPLVWLPLFFVSLFDCLMSWRFFATFLDNLLSAFLLSPLAFFVAATSACFVIIKYAFANRNPQIVSAAKFWLIVVWACFVLFVDNVYFIDALFYDTQERHINFLYAAFFILLTAATAFAAFKQAPSPLLTQNLSVMLLLVALYQIPGYNETACELWGIVFTLTILGLCLRHACKSSDYKSANFISALIALRIFGIYLQVVGDLSITGIGLIVSGGFLLLLVKLWYKFKQHHALKGNTDEQ